MVQRLLLAIPWVVVGAIVTLPLLCILLYRRGKVRTSLVFSHLWCMIAFCLLGIVIHHFVRRYQERVEYADRANRLLQMCQTFRAGNVQEGQPQLDEYLAGTLYRTAYDIPDAKMTTLDPEVLWIWQEVKAYYDTYDVNEPYAGAMTGRLLSKLACVPYSDMQLAIRKFEETYGSGEPAPAPPVDLKSWIGPPLGDEALTGKVILLDFWNTHCGPCVKAHPDLQKIHETYQERGLVVVACAGGDEGETRRYMDKHGYTFGGGMVSRQMYLDYAIRAQPTYFLIDRHGDLVWGPEHRLPTDEELAGLLEGAG